jgi:hypothetical protein
MSILSEIQWKCEADLDQRVKFGRMTVSCEGYNGVDDEWVVDGSCSLQYELDRTYSDEWEYSEENTRNGWKFGPFFGWVSLAGVVLAILRSLTSPFRGALFPYFVTSALGWIINRFRTPAVRAEIPPHTRRTRFGETYDEPEDIGVGRQTRTTGKYYYSY